MKIKKALSLLFVIVLSLCLLAPAALAAGNGNIIIGGGSNPAPVISAPGTPEPYTGNGGVVITGGNNPPAVIPGKTPTPEIYVSGNAPIVTKDPSSETCDPGDAVVFVAHADNAESINWYVTVPDSYNRYPAADIGMYIAGMYSSGADTDRLVLYGIAKEMNGFMVDAEFTNSAGVSRTATAWINVNQTPEPTATPEPTPTPTPAPTPTPMPTTGTGNGGTSNGNGPGALGNGQYASNGSQPHDMPSSEGYNSLTGTEGSGISNVAVSEKPAAKSHTGAYVLAAGAGAVILGAVAIMALYMKGKISLGKFEQLIGGSEGSDAFDNSGDFYNPDDFHDGGEI